MASRKRELQKDATHPNTVGDEKDAIDRLTEVALMLDLKIHEAERLGLPKVRLEMIERLSARLLLALIRGSINAKVRR